MKHHLSALKGSSVTGCQYPFSSDPSRVKICRAHSVSGSFQVVRFSFLRLQRCPSPCVLRMTSSSFTSSLRFLGHESVLLTREEHEAKLCYLANNSFIHTWWCEAAPTDFYSDRWKLSSSARCSRSPEPDSGRTNSYLAWVHLVGWTDTLRGTPQPRDSCWPPETQRDNTKHGKLVFKVNHNIAFAN